MVQMDRLVISILLHLPCHQGENYFGANSAYDEVNNRLGIGTTSPTDSVTMVNAGGTAGFSIDSGSGVSYKYDWISMKHDGVMRWSRFKLNDADGSLMIGRYNDAGAFQDTPLFISRFNGDITLTGNLFMGNGKNFYIGSDAGTAPNTWFDSSIWAMGLTHSKRLMDTVTDLIFVLLRQTSGLLD